MLRSFFERAITVFSIFSFFATSLLAGCETEKRSENATTVSVLKNDSKIESGKLNYFPPGLTDPIPKPIAGLGEALQNADFCVHVKYHNNFYLFYSENYAEAWVTAGACDIDGPRRAVDRLIIGWAYKGEIRHDKSCENVDSCTFSERNYGTAKQITCAIAIGGVSTALGSFYYTSATDTTNCL